MNQQLPQIVARSDHLDGPAHELRLLPSQTETLRGREERSEKPGHIRARPLGNFGLAHELGRLGRLRVEELESRTVGAVFAVSGQSRKRLQAKGALRFGSRGFGSRGFGPREG